MRFSGHAVLLRDGVLPPPAYTRASRRAARASGFHSVRTVLEVVGWPGDQSHAKTALPLLLLRKTSLKLWRVSFPESLVDFLHLFPHSLDDSLGPFFSCRRCAGFAWNLAFHEVGS